MELEELQSLGTEMIDALLSKTEGPNDLKELANFLATHCLQRAGSNRSESGRIRVPVVVETTLAPGPKKDDDA